MARRLTNAEIVRQIPAARRAAKEDQRAGRVATSARYDATSNRIVVELSNGCLFGFQPTLVPGLRGATPEQIAKVAVAPGGYGLYWEEPEADIGLPGLLVSSIGRREQVRTPAGLAGKTTARAKSARANGAKGGRPRKKALARG